MTVIHLEPLLGGVWVVLAHELHEAAVHAQHRAQVDLLLGEEGVAHCQHELRGGVDALGVARSEERADKASPMRGHVREETVLRGVRVLILEDILRTRPKSASMRSKEL